MIPPYTNRKNFIRTLGTIVINLCLVIFLTAFTLQPSFFSLLVPEKIETLKTLPPLCAEHSYLILENVQLNYTGYDCVKNGRLTGQYFYALVQNKCCFFLLSPRESTCLTSPMKLSKLHLKVVETDSVYHSMLRSFSNDIQWSPTHLSEISPDYILVENNGEYLYTLLFVVFLLVIILVLIKSLFQQVKILLGILSENSAKKNRQQ